MIMTQILGCSDNKLVLCIFLNSIPISKKLTIHRIGVEVSELMLVNDVLDME